MKIYIIARHCEYEILAVFLSEKTANNFINDNYGDNDAIYLHEEIIDYEDFKCSNCNNIMEFDYEKSIWQCHMCKNYFVNLY